MKLSVVIPAMNEEGSVGQTLERTVDALEREAIDYELVVVDDHSTDGTAGIVDAIGAERHSAAIISSLVELARSMRMDIVAEGVESFEQVAYLRDQGIRLAQGYVFAPPLPGGSFLQLLEATDPVAAPVRDNTGLPGSRAGPNRAGGRATAA